MRSSVRYASAWAWLCLCGSSWACGEPRESPGRDAGNVLIEDASLGDGAVAVDASVDETGALDASGTFDGAPVDSTTPALDSALAEASIDAAVGDAANSDASEPAGKGMQPIPAPVPDDCIKNVGAGDHTFTCSGVTFHVKVDEVCTKRSCGLIFDVHGGTMGGRQMRDNTKLHELAPKHGYIVVHPSATPEATGGSWDLTADPPKIVDFFKRMAKAFHTDPKRHHVTGFSQGSAVTFYFLCRHSDLLASAAPVSGNSADTTCINAAWKPRVPFLFMTGTLDTALTIETGNMRVEKMISELQLTGGAQIAGDGHYTRKRWTGADGMELDYLVHDYGGQAVLGGHCIPGGTDIPGSANNFILNATTCTTGDIKLHWGELALQYFMTHTRR
jgi:polyhydroxybutyrate depolymerase